MIPSPAGGMKDRVVHDAGEIRVKDMQATSPGDEW